MYPLDSSLVYRRALSPCAATGDLGDVNEAVHESEALGRPLCACASLPSSSTHGLKYRRKCAKNIKNATTPQRTVKTSNPFALL